MTFKKKEPLIKEPSVLIGLARTNEGWVEIEITVDETGTPVKDSFKVSPPNLRAIIHEQVRINLGNVILGKKKPHGT